eukprot:TRINITY_DN4326_c0_g1_i1.p2 TRINITY_DN4326_c0_g1~~TRINITY_DN4326_c0_g1_i1.p2  ORF type:complete len:212 (+),score=-4.44 TRINITY_DN4326_c0_g1_i1:463-1098(+)
MLGSQINILQFDQITKYNLISIELQITQLKNNTMLTILTLPLKINPLDRLINSSIQNIPDQKPALIAGQQQRSIEYIIYISFVTPSTNKSTILQKAPLLFTNQYFVRTEIQNTIQFEQKISQQSLDQILQQYRTDNYSQNSQRITISQIENKSKDVKYARIKPVVLNKYIKNRVQQDILSTKNSTVKFLSLATSKIRPQQSANSCVFCKIV